ncbi:amidohydrolase [Colletotrichum plurivorum]|uniref:Amidohydrolase n=1 Tax=Colletotrichum plurivorum TaxID=2175906 RepID=A0A8H6KNA0_9PEZI|nr:amidohydrolase [Colletotrichum plurivorum]
MGVPNSTLIRDVKIFTGTEVIERGYVHVLGGVVAEVGEGEYSGELSAGMTVVSRPGDSVMPGLIGEPPRAASAGADGVENNLRFGVTTVYDVGDGPENDGEVEKVDSDAAKIAASPKDARPLATQQIDDKPAADADIPYGLRLQLQMRALVREAGKAPEDVLRSATADAADRLGLHDRGRIEAERKADIVLVRGDVLEELGKEDGKGLPIEAVWRDGVFASAF